MCAAGHQLCRHCVHTVVNAFLFNTHPAAGALLLCTATVRLLSALHTHTQYAKPPFETRNGALALGTAEGRLTLPGVTPLFTGSSFHHSTPLIHAALHAFCSERTPLALVATHCNTASCTESMEFGSNGNTLPLAIRGTHTGVEETL